MEQHEQWKDLRPLTLAVDLAGETGGDVAMPLLLWHVARGCRSYWSLEIIPIADGVQCSLALTTGERFVGQGAWVTMALMRAVRQYLAWEEET